MEVYLGEYEEQKGKLTESKIKAIEKEAEKKLENEIVDFIDMVKKEYKHDIFGFSNIVYQQDPKVWKKVRKDWDKFFIESDIVIDTKIEIVNSALLK
jgi:spore germination protein KC